MLDGPRDVLDGTRAMLDNPYVGHRSNTIRGPVVRTRIVHTSPLGF